MKLRFRFTLSNTERQPKNYFWKINFQKLIPWLKANLLNSSVEFWSVRPQSDSSKKVLNSFKEVGLAKSEKKLHSYFFSDPKCHIFSKSSQQMWLSEKATKYFEEVNLAKSRKKFKPYISEDRVLYFWNHFSNYDSVRRLPST